MTKNLRCGMPWAKASHAIIFSLYILAPGSDISTVYRRRNRSAKELSLARISWQVGGRSGLWSGPVFSQRAKEEGIWSSFVDTVWVSVVPARQQGVFFLCPMKGPLNLRPGPSLQAALHSPRGSLGSSSLCPGGTLAKLLCEKGGR